MRPLAAMALVLSLAACQQSDPYFLRSVDLSQNSLSIDAKQRVVMVGKRPSGETVVCAEPSPDALSAFASSLAANANLSADTLGSVAKPSIGGGVSTANAEQAAYIGARNATIQMLRDGLYRACEAYLNGSLDKFGYALILANYGRLMGGLLMVEGMTRPALAPPVIINAAATTTGEEPRAAATAPPATVTVNASSAPDAAAIEKMSDALFKVAFPLFNPRSGDEADNHDLMTACLLAPSVAGSANDQICRMLVARMPRPTTS